MRSDIRYLFFGLLIGGGTTAIVITGIFILGFFQVAPKSKTAMVYEQPLASVPSPTYIPTIVPTIISTLSLTPTTNPLVEEEALEEDLAYQIVQALPTYGGDWNILIRADGNHTVFSRDADQSVHIASIIKVPIAMLFFKTLDEKGIPPFSYPEFLSTRGIGRTYQQLLKAMLVESEENATGTLRDIITESKIDVDAYLQTWGAFNTNISNRYSTAEDIASLYESLYFGRSMTPESRQIILDLMSTYTVNDDTRLGVIRPSLPPGAKFYNKRGTVATGELLIVGDAALLTWPQDGKEKVYVVVVLSYPGEKIPTSDVKLVRGVEAIARLFLDFAVPKSP